MEIIQYDEVVYPALLGVLLLLYNLYRVPYIMYVQIAQLYKHVTHTYTFI